MSTILNDDELPPLRPRDHPEPHTMQWSQAEMRAIRAYARAAINAHDAKLAQQVPVAWLESDQSTASWPARDLFFGFSATAYSSRMHFGNKPKGTSNRLTPLYTHPAPQQADRQRVPEELRDRIAEAHDASLDDDHTGCRSILNECLRMLAGAAVAPAQADFVHDPACKMCEGRGYYVAGYSGREDDGNAPIHEECDCWIPNPEAPAQCREPSPTAGMTLGQRILHVGGRTNAAGYVEFGSVQAVDALVRHVLRDLPDAPPVRANAEWPREADPLTQLIQRLNSTPYNLTKDECIEVAKELRAALAGTERQPLPQWQIDEIIKQHTGGFIGGMHFVHLARAIEIAHGIGGKDCQPLTQWQPIETAPKHGTVIDLWHEEFGRYAGCFWGKPIHSCGEMGRFCDSDWHSLKDSWVDEFNEQHPESEFTHWMPLPAAPDAAPEVAAQEGGAS